MGWRAILADRVIIALFAFRLAYTAGIGIIWGFLPVLADARFHLSSSHIGILVMPGVLVSGLIQTPMGYLADRINRKAMVLAGGLVAGLAVLAGVMMDWYHLRSAFGLGAGCMLLGLVVFFINVRGLSINAD